MSNTITASTTALALLFASTAIACGGDGKPRSEQAPPMATKSDHSDKTEANDDTKPPTAVCGNGTVEGDEECDDGNQSDDDDCTHRTKARCGDGIASRGEECDDGNDDDADGCSTECKHASMSAGSGGSSGAKSDGQAGAGNHMAGRGGSNDKDTANASGVPGGTPACTTCRTAKCADYQGLGYNVVTGCFNTIDAQFDAPAMDPTFISDCTAMVRCAYDKKCGFGAADASECFCGTADTESCFASDKAANGPCMAERVEQASRSKDLSEIGARASVTKRIRWGGRPI